MSNYPETSHNDRDSDMDHLRGTFSEIPGLYGDSAEGITFQFRTLQTVAGIGGRAAAGHKGRMGAALE